MISTNYSKNASCLDSNPTKSIKDTVQNDFSNLVQAVSAFAVYCLFAGQLVLMTSLPTEFLICSHMRHCREPIFHEEHHIIYITL